MSILSAREAGCSCQQGDPARLTAPTVGDFDQLPYPSMPFAYTQPAHLAALATLYGLLPPRRRQRPRPGTWVCVRRQHQPGSPKPVSWASICLPSTLTMDLVALEHSGSKSLNFSAAIWRKPSWDTFDYVICHGVFSWVQEEHSVHVPDPMGHVILCEFYFDRQTQYFADYGRQYTDMPMPVRLVKQGDTLVPDRLLRASDFPDTWARPIVPSGRRSPLTSPPSASTCPRARSAFAGARKASGTLRRGRRVVGKPTCK
jgi:Molybdopterin oxidoreductase